MITYFPHDVNARNDEKLLSLRMEMGATGVGIYWMLLEKLATANGQRLEYNLNKLSWDLHCEWNDIKDVIGKYDLFVIDSDDNTFYSKRLCEHAQQVESVAAKRSRAGRAGAEAKNGGAQPCTAVPVEGNNAMGTVEDSADDKQMLNTCQANAEHLPSRCQANAEPKKRIEKNKIKEKENKIKENKSSSENAHTREEEAAEAAEEEDLMEEDYWFLVNAAHDKVRTLKLKVDEDWKLWKLARWLTTPKKEDRDVLAKIMEDLIDNGKTPEDLLRAMEIANRQRPINPIPLPYWNAIRYVYGLRANYMREIMKATLQRQKQWDKLAEAVQECDGNKKITQPGRFLLSRLK